MISKIDFQDTIYARTTALETEPATVKMVIQFLCLACPTLS